MKFCDHDTSRLSTFRFTKIPKVLILLFVVCFSHQNLFSQHVSSDNHKGDWEDPGTWNPEWSAPSKFISGYNITINGYVTSEGSLSFYNLATLLIVNDTLVINGNLYLHNNNDLIINDSGILIVRGDLYFDEHTLINSNGYFIITGDIYKDNDHPLGLFKSNDNPPKVFIGGSVSPAKITNNFFNYPVLNCSTPVIPYEYSGCSSGNMYDLKKDPIYPFFQSTCKFYVPAVRISVCPGDSIFLAATGGENYNWKGPAGFGSNLPDPCLTNADSAMSGIYTVYITADHDCEETDTINVLVNPKPAVSITSSNDILCLNSQRTLTGIPAGGKFEVENGLGSITANLLTAYGLGEIKIKYIYSNICTNTDTQMLVVHPWIPVDIRSSDDTLCLYENRTLKGTPSGGTFSVVKGPGLLAGDTLKPTDTGEINIKYIYDNVCSQADTQIIVVNPLIDVSISSSDDTLCLNDLRVLSGIPAGGQFILENGPGLLIGNSLKALNTGEIVIKYLYNRMCANTTGQTIISSERAASDAGENQELRYVFETTLAASIHPRERGTWTLVSGSGNIQDINSPESKVTGLSPGENVYLWTVTNGACESASEVTVTVLDLVIPSVFTPNDDGINDNFYIPDYNYPFELTIFNQWGLIEYESHSFTDHWDGTNNKGNQLPPETYFYILKFENGQTKKGTVLIVK